MHCVKGIPLVIEYRLNNEVLRLSIPRDVLSTGVRDLYDQLQAVQNSQQVQQAPWRILELDLTRAKMIDSMGLNYVVHILKWAKERNAKTRILIRDNNLDRLLRFTRMNEHAEVVRA
jgi:ABC-type transporter Mla MlaB component